MIVELVRQEMEIKRRIEIERKRHAEEMSILESKLMQCTARILQEQAALRHDKIDLAKSVIRVECNTELVGDDSAKVRQAIEDIANGCKILRREYLGTKNYDRWYHQGTSHAYGFGPRHGEIVFSIGLLHSVRQRETEPLLTPEESDAAVYYLLNLPKILDLNARAKSLASSAV